MNERRRARARARRGAAVILLPLALLASCSGSDDDGPGPTESKPSSTTTGESTTVTDGASTSTVAPGDVVIQIVLRDGVVVEGGGEHEVPLDTNVMLSIESDTTDEAHVHGYDHELEVGPDAVATVLFTADQPGVYEVELHDAETVLAELVVS